MPELPEVETVRRDLSKKLDGRQILKIQIFDFKNVAPSAAFLTKHLPQMIIWRLDRRGKLLIVKLRATNSKLKTRLKNSKNNLLIHLKMTGQLIYQEKNLSLFGGHSLSNKSLAAAVGGPLPNRFTRVQLDLSGGTTLFFNDLRKFAYLKLVDDQELATILAKNYGPEPLSPEFTLDFFQQLIKRHQTNIKALLLKQTAIAGLGNIYVDEALFLADIKPKRRAKSLTKQEISNLYQAINQIISQAIKYRGTTFSRFVDASGRQGNFSQHLKVYGRAGQACLVCQTPIVKIKLAGRGTHYCLKCQR